MINSVKKVEFVLNGQVIDTVDANFTSYELKIKPDFINKINKKVLKKYLKNIYKNKLLKK